MVLIKLVLHTDRRHRAIRVLKSAPLVQRGFSVRTIPESFNRAERVHDPFLPKSYWGLRAEVTLSGDAEAGSFRVANLGWARKSAVPPRLEDRILVGPGPPSGERVECAFEASGLVALGQHGNIVIVSETYDSTVGSGGLLFNGPRIIGV